MRYFDGLFFDFYILIVSAKNNAEWIEVRNYNSSFPNNEHEPER